MGTSQAINPGVKGEPKWGKLSREFSIASKKNDIPMKSLEKIMSTFVDTVAHNGQSGGSGSKSFGVAGKKTLSNFFNIISSTSYDRFKIKLAFKGIVLPNNPTINDIKNSILLYCSEGAENLDETAANAALKKVLEDFFRNNNDNDGFDEDLIHLDTEESKSHIITFMTEYIVEFSDELFGEKIFHKHDGNRKRTFEQVRNYIKEILKEDYSMQDIESVDWKGVEGREVINKIQDEVLEVFER